MDILYLGCEDESSSEKCNEWKTLGWCNDDYFGPNCRKTCGKCGKYYADTPSYIYTYIYIKCSIIVFSRKFSSLYIFEFLG